MYVVGETDCVCAIKRPACGLTVSDKGRKRLLESRLPSGAANPYLVLACHLAAGLSALAQEVPSPPRMDVERAQKLPPGHWRKHFRH